MEINDNLFQQAVSCPLKLYHFSEQKNYRPARLPFKHRNKLRLRDVISLRFDNRKFTSDDTASAISETETWLNEDTVTICGAVIASGKLLSRIPILVKSGNRFTIIQVHGKLRKRSEPGAINEVPKKRTTAVYLLKAAYRRELLLRKFPDAAIETKFYFPERGFKASFDGLLQQMDQAGKNNSALNEEYDRLFAEVDATKGVEVISSSLPENVSHKKYSGLSVSEVCDTLSAAEWGKGNQFNVKVHHTCKHCEFRINPELEKGGCWKQFFFDEEITEPERHVFELIGHGNDIDSDNGFYYQEQVPYSDQFSSFDIIEKYGGNLITIQQRRVLQLLRAKGDQIPKLWAKPALKEINRLSYPLHFLDFEAATYAIPMNRGGRPYSPICFQFSCHTLNENGKITHHEWLDSAAGSGYPHVNFVEALYKIPGITDGTIVQYSQFEQQALRQLNAEFRRNAMLYGQEILMLKELIEGSGNEDPRFFDLSRIIRDAYFNRYLEGSLGLKQVLKSTLFLQKNMEPNLTHITKIADTEIDFFKETPEGGIADPYKLVQDHDYAIGDGESAMNAYISLKCGLLSPGEELEIPTLLKRYCSLDSYALVLIFNHLKSLASKMSDEKDLVLF